MGIIHYIFIAGQENKTAYLPLALQNVECPGGGGGVLPMWWVIHMCRGFDPLFSLWQDRARSFWGIFSHPPTAKLSFGVQKLPIFTKIDLFGPKFNFFPRSFWVQFSAASGTHTHQFSGRIPRVMHLAWYGCKLSAQKNATLGVGVILSQSYCYVYHDYDCNTYFKLLFY